MALWDKLTGELIDIIQWLDDTTDTLVFRFPRYNNEIKHNARLVVREGQAAVFVNEGRVADVFGPGTHTLTTRNLPVLATLKGWKHGFASPFKAEIYFCSTRQFTNLKWGTPGPCTMRDPELGAVRVTAFGLYAIRIKDPAVFVREVAGTDGHFTTEEIQDNLKGKIGLRIKEVLPELDIPVLDLENKVYTLGEMLKERLAPAFEEMGIGLAEIQVQDVGLPEEVERAIDKAGAMKAIGDMQRYTRYETARSINDAANNPGGLAAAGVGVGMGFGMGSQTAGALGGMVTPGVQPVAADGTADAVPPPLPSRLQVYVALDGRQSGPFDLASLQAMARSGQVTRDTLAWKQGMHDWAAAGIMPELTAIFEAVPPPLR